MPYRRRVPYSLFILVGILSGACHISARNLNRRWGKKLRYTENTRRQASPHVQAQAQDNVKSSEPKERNTASSEQQQQVQEDNASQKQDNGTQAKKDTQEQTDQQSEAKEQTAQDATEQQTAQEEQASKQASQADTAKQDETEASQQQQQAQEVASDQDAQAEDQQQDAQKDNTEQPDATSQQTDQEQKEDTDNDVQDTQNKQVAQKDTQESKQEQQVNGDKAEDQTTQKSEEAEAGQVAETQQERVDQEQDAEKDTKEPGQDQAQEQKEETAKQQQAQEDVAGPITGEAYYGGIVPEEAETYRTEAEELPQEQEVVKLEQPQARERRRRETYMRFSYEETPLSQVVQDFAQKKGLNVALPYGEEEIKHTITFKHEKPISISRAEKYIHLFLDLAGYRMYPHGSYYMIIKKRDNQRMRHPAALYVNMSPYELPDTDEEIQAIYSLANLRVPDKTDSNEPINQLLKSVLSHPQTYLFDQQSNSIIISDGADNIAEAMKILLTLDSSDSPEILYPIQLYNSSAKTVADLLNQQIIAKAQDKKTGRPPQQLSTVQHFAPNVHVVADNRRNRLLLLGREGPVTRIRDFVQEYIDVQRETGKSILHVYELQYLDAEDFAPILQNLVKPVGGAEGKQAEKKADETGPTRYFEDVIVMAEPRKAEEAEQAQEGTKQQKKVKFGGNRLIIAARNDDWQRLQEIISQLDKPQKQVIIEVMIADVSVENNKSLGAQTRNPKFVDLPKDVGLQAAHLSDVVTSEAGQNINNNTSIVADLLRLIQQEQGGQQSIAPGLIGQDNQGGMLISITDSHDGNNGIWSLIRILDRYTSRHVLAHPYLVTRDNVQAQAKNINKRRAQGEFLGAEARDNDYDVPIRKIKDIEARLVVNVTPRVSSQNRVNMQIDIDIQEFIGATVNRETRKVTTNTNMESGQILVLGGLSRIREQETTRETPFLGRLPVIGQLFRSHAKTYAKTNLIVFMTPTIVEPKLMQGLDRYTDDKVQQSYGEAQGAALEGLHQPITHFFFGGMEDNETPLDSYLDEVQYKQQQEDLERTYVYEPSYEIMKLHPQEESDIETLYEVVRDQENPLSDAQTYTTQEYSR